MDRDALVNIADSAAFTQRITREDAGTLVELLDAKDRRIRELEQGDVDGQRELARDIRRAADLLRILADSLDS